MRKTAFFKIFLVMVMLMMPTLAFSKDKKKDRHSSKTDKSKSSNKSNQDKSKGKDADKKSAANDKKIDKSKDKSDKSEKEKNKEDLHKTIFKSAMERDRETM